MRDDTVRLMPGPRRINQTGLLDVQARVESIRSGTPACGGDRLVVDLHTPRDHAMSMYLDLGPDEVLSTLISMSDPAVAIRVWGCKAMLPGVYQPVYVLRYRHAPV